ncbi:helix-turn-helix transcriptional regulator [Cupriavidus sp. CP313]
MNLPPADYLDAHDLATIFKVTPATILLRFRTKPHTLPLPAPLGPNFPLRWRQADVAFWLTQNEL